MSAAQKAYPLARQPWLDLSTGIAPWSYPIGGLDRQCWQRLPAVDALQELEAAAATCFRLANPDQIVAVHGSDFALRLLARLLPAERVMIVGHSYSGYRAAWPDARTGSFEQARGADLLVCAHPNNPDGTLIDIPCLQRLRNLRIVDEAFADAEPEHSLLPNRNGAIVLRSFGKFFGLAGVRLGFVIADKPFAREVRAALGDWPVSGPAIVIATRAYADFEWQERQRERLKSASARLSDMLTRYGIGRIGGTAFFQLAETSDANNLFVHLCRQGILVRPFSDRPGAIRFGLPGSESEWDRLDAALNLWREKS